MSQEHDSGAQPEAPDDHVRVAEAPTFDDGMNHQLEDAEAKEGGDLRSLLYTPDSWKV